MRDAISAVSRALRQGDEVPDAALDVWLSPPYREVSGRFWTPVAVARCAATWLAAAGAVRVLDVGAGTGKFCVVAALSTDLVMTGIEQRGALVLEALSLARRFRVEHRCELIEGVIEGVDLAAFDALYLFNSFAENIYPPDAHLDDTVELSPGRLGRDLRTLESALARMRTGALLLTYHGFGGQIPDTFDLLREEEAGTGTLRLWSKNRTRAQGQAWVEVADEVWLVDDPGPRR